MKRLLNAVQLERDRLSTLINSISDEVWFADTQGKFVLANPSALRHFGLVADEELEVEKFAASLEVYRPDGSPRPAGEAPALCALRGEIVRNQEEIVRTPHSGELRYRQVSSSPVKDGGGAVIGSVSVVRDVTEDRKAQQALRESEERFRMMADAMPQLAWTAHADGFIFWYNQRWYEYTGTTPAQMEGWGWQSVHDPGVLPKVLECWKASIATGEPFHMEFPLRGADGRFRLFLTRGIPMKDADGRVVRWFGTNTDIAERSEFEQQIQASLREKEVMLREIHHRVKNNLQVISSLVNLQADGLDNPEFRGLFQDVRDRVRSMALVHEKLYQSESLARVDFAEYARSLLNYLWRAHGSSVASVQLVLDLEPVPLSVESAVPCGLILNELVTNALKHAFHDQSGGEIRAVLHLDTDGRVRLSVRDNGIGLPPGLDWQQSKSLGLRLVQMLAGQLNGTVEVNNDGGTEFVISFAETGRLER
jgi:PAS domain S-box-containing protein